MEWNAPRHTAGRIGVAQLTQPLGWVTIEYSSCRDRETNKSWTREKKNDNSDSRYPTARFTCANTVPWSWDLTGSLPSSALLSPSTTGSRNHDSSSMLHSPILDMTSIQRRQH